MAVMAVCAEQTSSPSFTTTVFSQSEAPAETEDSALGSGSEEEITENGHHSWAQATAEEAISPAITEWRFVV